MRFVLIKGNVAKLKIAIREIHLEKIFLNEREEGGKQWERIERVGEETKRGFKQRVRRYYSLLA